MDRVSCNCICGFNSSLTMPFSSIAASMFNIPFSNTHLKKFRININVSLIKSQATHRNQHLGFKNGSRNRHPTHSKPSESFTQLKEAIRILQNDLSPQTLSAVLSAQEDTALILQIFDWASRKKNYEHDNEVCRMLFTKLCSSREFDEVERLLDEMSRNGWEISEDMLISAITSCCESHRIDKAENILNKMEEYGSRPKVLFYNRLLKSVSTKKKFHIAKIIYYQMVRFQVLSNLQILNFVIRALCLDGNVDEASDLLEKLSEKNCRPNIVTFTILTKAYIDVGRMEKAMQLIEQMWNMDCFPDSAFYNTIMDRLLRDFCETGRSWEAISFLDVLEDKGYRPDIKCYTTVINALCKEGKVDKAVEVLVNMQEKGCPPNKITYTNLIKGLLAYGKIEAVIDFFEQMKDTDKGLASAAVTSTLEEFCKTGNSDKAYALLNDFIKMGLIPNVNIYNILIHGFCREGKTEQVCNLLEQMGAQGFVLNLYTYNTLICDFCKRGRIQEATELVDVMLAKGVVPNASTYNPILYLFCRRGNIEEATELLGEMLMNGFVPNVKICTALMNGTDGLEAEAIDILDKMVSKGCVPNNVTYEELIKQLRKAGSVK